MEGFEHALYQLSYSLSPQQVFGFIKFAFIQCVCMCVCSLSLTHTHVPVLICEEEDSFPGSVILQPRAPRDRTQVVRLGSMSLYPLSLLLSI